MLLPRLRIAVIGAGVSGNTAAYLLAKRHEVTLFEASDYAGGHAHTHDIDVDGDCVIIDTGFMVFNERTYPNFCRLLGELGVESRPSDMSLSVQVPYTDLEFQGSSLGGLFAQRKNLLRPQFWRLLKEITRFNRLATNFATHNAESTQTLGELLDEWRFGQELREWYLTPMTAAIWSAPPAAIEVLPAHFILGFYRNHGLLQLRNRPQWRTIVGGARTYVRALMKSFRGRLRLSTPVHQITRTAGSVAITTRAGVTEVFDAVVLACHADESLAMLANPSDDERRILSAFPYQANEAIVHTDAMVMPRRRAAWASWNYTAGPASGGERSVMVTYHLNRLQGFSSPRSVFVTLNPLAPIRDEYVIKRLQYTHPTYSVASIAAQREHATINGANCVYFCGAYWGYGFHEDGVRSALRAVAPLK
jgi:uncharacterized protein